MGHAGLTVAACAALLWAHAVPTRPTAQQSCDSARVVAWQVYVSCVDRVVAKNATGVYFDQFAAFARCRHAHSNTWLAFQRKASLAQSTCIGSRYTDNADQTVTDKLTGLVWEKKDDSGGVHDKGNAYSWSTGTNKEDGTAFTSFLATINNGFAGASGWRLPTLAELQTIVLDFPCSGSGLGPTCSCPSSTCVVAALDAANTQPGFYWSATSYLPDPSLAWFVGFSAGGIDGYDTKTSRGFVRAVRGGL